MRIAKWRNVVCIGWNGNRQYRSRVHAIRLVTENMQLIKEETGLDFGWIGTALANKAFKLALGHLWLPSTPLPAFMNLDSEIERGSRHWVRDASKEIAWKTLEKEEGSRTGIACSVSKAGIRIAMTEQVSQEAKSPLTYAFVML
jgi:hypothetical protein